MIAPQVEVMGLQVCPAAQQEVQPQGVSPDVHSETHTPPLRILPQGQVIALQLPAAQYWPVGHLPVLQVPPHPSLAPQVLPTQVGAHLQTPDLQVLPAGQLPYMQVPPQPSSAPQYLPLQSGLHLQVPLEQNSPPGQVPFMQ